MSRKTIDNDPTDGNATALRGVPLQQTPTPTDNYIMKYDQALNEWRYEPDGGSGADASAIQSIPVRALPTPTNNQVLTYNSGLGQWIYQTPSSDVNIYTASGTLQSARFVDCNSLALEFTDIDPTNGIQVISGIGSTARLSVESGAGSSATSIVTDTSGGCRLEHDTDVFLSKAPAGTTLAAYNLGVSTPLGLHGSRVNFEAPIISRGLSAPLGSLFGVGNGTSYEPLAIGSNGQFLSIAGGTAQWASGPTDTNIYTSDGTLSGLRTVNCANHTLQFTNATNGLRIQSSALGTGVEASLNLQTSLKKARLEVTDGGTITLTHNTPLVSPLLVSQNEGEIIELGNDTTETIYLYSTVEAIFGAAINCCGTKMIISHLGSVNEFNGIGFGAEFKCNDFTIRGGVGDTSNLFIKSAGTGGTNDLRIDVTDDGATGTAEILHLNRKLMSSTMVGSIPSILDLGDDAWGETNLRSPLIITTGLFDVRAGLRYSNAAPKGTLLIGDSFSYTPLAVGTNGKILIADSTQANGVRWGDDSVAANTIYTSNGVLLDNRIIDFQDKDLIFSSTVGSPDFIIRNAAGTPTDFRISNYASNLEMTFKNSAFIDLNFSSETDFANLRIGDIGGLSAGLPKLDIFCTIINFQTAQGALGLQWNNNGGSELGSLLVCQPNGLNNVYRPFANPFVPSLLRNDGLGNTAWTPLIPNSYGEMFAIGIAPATPLTQNLYSKVNATGIMQSGYSTPEWITSTTGNGNRLTYFAGGTKMFKFTYSVAGDGNDRYFETKIYLNGVTQIARSTSADQFGNNAISKRGQISCSFIWEVNSGDFFELWILNTQDNSSFFLTNLTVNAIELNNSTTGLAAAAPAPAAAPESNSKIELLESKIEKLEAVNLKQNKLLNKMNKILKTLQSASDDTELTEGR